MWRCTVQSTEPQSQVWDDIVEKRLICCLCSFEYECCFHALCTDFEDKTDVKYHNVTQVVSDKSFLLYCDVCLNKMNYRKEKKYWKVQILR